MEIENPILEMTPPEESSNSEVGSSNTENVIEIKNLSRSFGKTLALDNVSLRVPKGVVVGLVGLNGAGKTTLIKHLLGLLRAQAGSVSVFGTDPSRHPERTLDKVGYLTEEDTLPGWMTVQQLLRFSKPFYPKWDDGYAAELIRSFDISVDKKIRTLSKGQKSRCGLVVALAHHPELLLLDEPSSGLDPVIRQDILSAIIRLIGDSGRTVLFSSHLLDEVQRVCDVIAVMREGKLVVCDNLEALRTKYKRATIRSRSASSSQSPPKVPVLGEWQNYGDEWNGIINVDDQDAEKLSREFNIEILELQGVSLHEWFLDLSR